MGDALQAGSEEPPKKSIVVNCSHTRYHVVRAAVASLGWYAENEDRDDVPPMFHGVVLHANTQSLSKQLSLRGITYDAAFSPQILWLDKSVLPSRVAALSCHHRINHFPGIDIITRKAVLFKRLMRIRRQTSCSSALSAALGAFPWSFSSSSEMPKLERLIAFQTQPQFFILKPNKGCQGKGIVVTSDPINALERIMSDKREKGDEYLVQLYVTPPLCIERKKFDLRIYVLLTSVVAGRLSQKGLRSSLNAKMFGEKSSNTKTGVAHILDGLHLLVHNDGLVRICAEDYVPPDDKNCGSGGIHLTNYAVNKSAIGFSVEEVEEGHSDMGVCKGNKRDFTFLRHYINALPENDSDVDVGACGGNGVSSTRWERVLRRIDMCIMLAILSGWRELQREFVGTGAARGWRSDGRNCFELLGFDIMLTEALEPVLMEVNHSPSLFCDSPFDFATKHRVAMDVFRVLEPHIPSLEKCDNALYAVHQASVPANIIEAATGLRRISPHRITTSSAAAAGHGDAWSEEEMNVFCELLQCVT